MVDEVNSTLCFDDNNKIHILHDVVYFYGMLWQRIIFNSSLHHQFFFRISAISGSGSAGRRKILVLHLLRSCRETEIKFLVRTLVSHPFLSVVYFAIFIWGDIACNGCWLYFGSMFLVLIAYIYLSQFEVFKYWFINTQIPCIHKKWNSYMFALTVLEINFMVLLAFIVTPATCFYVC